MMSIRSGMVVGVVALAVSFSACSTKSSGGGGGTQGGGTVPADLRDVERDGEGLVNTTFGAYPDRLPLWPRAASVLVLLKQVWGRTRAANPSYPAAQMKMMDDAVAALDAAIPAQDQAKAVQASNQIGLAVPELFDFFHPDAPIGVVRMDAVYRQVGIDAHFKNFDAAKKDLASLKDDWSKTKAAVATRAGTCHRVGGTATVASDIEQSLANLDTASPTNDAAVFERESENGALEIDTLELLFDCPADNVSPTSGLGAKCTDDTNCDKGQACDKANAGGKCAPDATNKIGTPCSSTVDCGSDSRAACQTPAGDNYPGGYCFMEPCDDVQVCPPGGTCVSLGGERPGCFKSCATDADCRAAEGYICQLFITTPPTGFGPSDKGCAFKCLRDTDCQSPLTCDIASGKCKP
jgi:hypothetical protein